MTALVNYMHTCCVAWCQTAGLYEMFDTGKTYKGTRFIVGRYYIVLAEEADDAN